MISKKKLFDDNVKLYDMIRTMLKNFGFRIKSDRFKKLLAKINNKRLNAEVDRLINTLSYHKRKNKLQSQLIIKIKKIALRNDDDELLDLIYNKEDLVYDELKQWNKDKVRLEKYYTKKVKNQ